MIIVRNSIIPFDGYKAMSIWPFIFVRNGRVFDKADERHERIHGRQQVEVTIIGAIQSVILFFAGLEWWSLCPLTFFYAWYITEWLIRCFIDDYPYRSVSFEQEAYGNEKDLEYLGYRKYFAWVKYLTTSYHYKRPI
jgi:hypothetical protein